MNPIAVHFGSGHALFTGAGIILAATLIAWTPWTRRHAVLRLTALVGVVVAAMSAAPLPWCFSSLWAGAVGGWFWAERAEVRPRMRYAARGVVQLLCVGAVALELPWQFMPSLGGGPFGTMYVIGDSISAGIGGAQERNWPTLFAAQRGVRVVDLSRGGETVSSALDRAPKVREERALVLLEIGGNDMLSHERGDVFARDLEALLKAVTGPGRCVVMMEIPLPPACNRFGVIQRRLAREYGVPLIPKRIFMRILGGVGATVDGLHLSQAGHERMAEILGEVLSPLLEASASGR